MENKDYNVNNLVNLQEDINKMDPVDIANELEVLPEKEVAIWIKLLKKDLLADAFTELKPENKLRIIDILTEENIKDLITDLDEDELVDTLQELPANIVRRLMSSHIDEKRRPIVNELLGYPEDSVGSIMTVNFLSIKLTDSKDKAMRRIIESDLDAQKLEQIWVTDDYLVLKGYVYLADIIRSVEFGIEDIINPITASVSPFDDKEVIARLSYKYDIPEIPVIDSENRLIGIVPAEDVIDVVHEELQEDMAKITGITDEGESYIDRSNFSIAKNRTLWLIICLLTATMTGFIIHRYESLLASAVTLTAYIPMLMDSGGNSGTQSSTQVITAMYRGEIGFKDFFKVMFKEMNLGLISGFILVVVNFIRMMVIDSSSLAVNLTVSITLLITIVLSNIMGGILPLIAEKVNVDPTVMAGPLITTIVDTFVLLIYFEVASRLLGL